MGYHADSEGRTRLTAGLRALADFLDRNPEVPAPEDAVVFVFPPKETDSDRRTEIDLIASRIYTQAYELVPGHYVTSRFFGPVEYRAVAIDRETTDADTAEGA